MVALVLAGGWGKRFAERGKGAKQVTAVDDRGQTLLEYALYDARLAGADKAVVVVDGSTQDDFHQAVGRRIATKLPLAYAVQTPPEVYGFEKDRAPLGTGHALLCGAQGIKEPFVVLNADDFYGRDAIAQAVRCAQEGRYGCVTYPVGQTVHKTPVHRGICLTDGHRIEGICECTFARDGAGKLYAEDATCRKYVGEKTPATMNLYALQPDVTSVAAMYFAAFLQKGGDGECLLGDVVTDYLGRTRQIMYQLPATCRWMGMTYRADLARVRAAIARLVDRGEYPACLWQ